jgi:hypothetical protein
MKRIVVEIDRMGTNTLTASSVSTTILRKRIPDVFCKERMVLSRRFGDNDRLYESIE